MSSERVRRRNRLLAIGILIILGALFGIEFLLFKSEQFSPSFIANSFVVWALWNLCVLVLVILLFMLLRDIVKVYLERRRNVPGARFRSRLLAFFISLSLLPTLLLFFFGSDLIQRTLEGWFKLPTREIADDAQAVAERYYEDVRQRAFFFAQLVGRNVKQTHVFSETSGLVVQERLELWLKEYGLDLIALYDGEDLVLQSINSRLPIEEIPEIPKDKVRKCLQGEPRHQVDPVMRGELVRGITPYFETGATQPSGAVVVGFFLDDSVAQKVKMIRAAAQQQSQTYVLRNPIKTTYFLIFSFVTLLILFAATWSGLHLAREITIPIEQLAHATKEVAAGNLAYMVSWKATDELGALVESFNKMTEDLRMSNERLSLSKVHLEAKNAEIEERRQYIETVLQNIAAGVVSVASDGRVRTANAAALDLLGLRGVTPVGMDFRELLRTAPDLGHMLAESFRYQEALDEKEITLKAAGRILTIALNTSFLQEASGGWQMLVVFNDMTQLIRAQRMETWREVARRIAHEIKNPLTPIQLSAQRIWKNYEKNSPNYRQVVEDGTATIIREVSTLKDMVNEFSNYARMPTVRLVPGDLNQLVQKTIAMYDGLFKEVAFRSELCEAPPTVPFDPEQLKRALINIVDNAIEAMAQQGMLTIRTSADPASGICLIEIADTGPGVGSDDKEKVFLPYFSTKKRGSGLGLAIVHQIIMDHNGSIRLEDNQPHGSRFVIELPVESRKQSAQDGVHA
ncbi:MAG: HAMP domain-containing protein [Acidobacteria bacterium]|nr:HAMP domain-containing protein [Acidobacteriota bacterium]